MKKIIIMGGKGHGTVIASVIDECREAGQKIECVGFLNDYEKEICGYKVLGGVQNNDWEKLPQDYMFITAFSNIRNSFEKHQLINELNIPIERLVNVIHPTALISSSSRIGCGVFIMPFTYIGPYVEIGNYTHLCGHSYVTHDVKLGESTFISNNATLNGWVSVGNGVHIGSNASIMEKINIGDYSVIGMGSVVIRDVPDFCKVVGNPARIIEE